MILLGITFLVGIFIGWSLAKEDSLNSKDIYDILKDSELNGHDIDYKTTAQIIGGNYDKG